MKELDELYMRRCITLAHNGLGSVQPNPMVGAVIVVDGKVVGEGWHKKYGGPHAEINAINSLSDKELLKKATMYVSLEPCAHFGKTPPCANALVECGVKRVVIGSTDPNPKVNGKGIGILRAAGIEVTIGVLQKECDFLNRRFFTFHNKKRPYIILKWAQTKDGYMDILRPDPEKEYKYWITNAELRTLTHKWRSEEDAILVGYNTFKNDKPLLTNRLYSGKNPVPVVLGRNEIKIGDNLFSLSSENNSMDEIMQLLYNQNIQSVIVEGGRKTLDRFLEADLYDEVRILVGNKIWGEGVPAPSLPAQPSKELSVAGDTVKYIFRQK